MTIVHTTDPKLIHSAWRGLHTFMFILVAGLILLAIVRDFSPAALIMGIVFTACVSAWEIARIRKSSWDRLFLIALLVSFAAFLWNTQDAAFLAFPLFFALTHAHGGWRALWEVSALTAVTVGVLWVKPGPSIGGTIGPIIGAAVALIVGLGFRILMSESQARAAAITELIGAKALATASAREAGELSERTRLAGDIHDTVAQGLSSIQLLLHSAENKAAVSGDQELVDTLVLARETAASNLAETRRIIAALQPAPLAGTTLPVALARVCSTTPLGSAVHFTVDGVATPLPEAAETALLRITQTLISNVVTHACASHTRVTLTYGEDFVAVDVVDNGCGFDPAAVGEQSFGLRGVRRRVRELGGVVTIETERGSGTGVQVRLPIEKEEP